MKFVFICVFLIAMIALAVVKITDKPSLKESLRGVGVTITTPPEKSSEDNGYDITIETPVDNGTLPPIDLSSPENPLTPASKIISALKKAEGCEVKEIGTGNYKSYTFSWVTEFRRPATNTVIKLARTVDWNPRTDTYDDLLKIKHDFESR